MQTAYRLNGELQLNVYKRRLAQRIGVYVEDLEHILMHKKYYLFLHTDELLKRVESVTYSVQRKDIFNTRFDRFIKNTISTYIFFST